MKKIYKQRNEEVIMEDNINRETHHFQKYIGIGAPVQVISQTRKKKQGGRKE